MDKKERIVIVGATSAIAEHCARLWLERAPVDLTLIGRDVTRLERVAADLRVRSPKSEIETLQTDFLAPSAIQQTVDSVASRGPLDIVLIAHGSLPDQGECQNSLPLCQQTLEINGVSPVLFAEAFARHMAQTNHGALALIGSVAGDRGRKSNYVYGAAKGMVSRYAEGLQHRFAGTDVSVVIVKPGPTDTPMTAQMKAHGAPLAPVERVAADIIAGIDNGARSIYTPRKWRLIMWVIRHLPPLIFNKLNI